MPLGLSSITELRQKRAALIGEAREIMNGATDDTLTAEQQERWDAAMADADKLKEQIDREERLHDAEAGLEQRQGTRLFGADGEGQRGQEDRTKKYGAAFRSWLQGGMMDVAPEQRVILQAGFRQDPELRALSVGTTTAGGYTVPDEMMKSIDDAMLSFGGMLEAGCTVLNTSTGADLPFPTGDDTSNVGAIISENTQITEQDVAFGQLILGAYMYTSKIVRVSLQLLQDSSINIEQYLGTKLGERLGRIKNTHLTTGTGSSQPKGVVTAATLGKAGATGQTTSVTYADLVDLEHSVDPAYRRQGKFMFADSTLKALKKLVDGQSRPLWVPGIAVREPDSILGYPYVINQDVDTMAASKKSILFGDFSKYHIRNVRDYQLVRFGEKYMDYLQVGFMGFARWDGDLVDAGTHPIKYYQNSAS